MSYRTLIYTDMNKSGTAKVEQGKPYRPADIAMPRACEKEKELEAKANNTFMILEQKNVEGKTIEELVGFYRDGERLSPDKLDLMDILVNNSFNYSVNEAKELHKSYYMREHQKKYL